MGGPELRWRAYRGRGDLAGMTVLRNTRVERDGEGEYITEAAMAETYEHLQRCDPATDIAVVEDADERIVGYGRVEWADLSEGYRCYSLVAEAFAEFATLDTDILDWAQARAETIAASHAHEDKRLVAQAAERTARLAELERRGFTPVSFDAVMVRPHLRDVANDRLPDGLAIRPVVEADWRAIWEADIEAFRDHNLYVEQTEEDFARLCDEAAGATDLWQIAFDADGQVVGQVRTHVNDGEASALICASLREYIYAKPF